MSIIKDIEALFPILEKTHVSENFTHYKCSYKMADSQDFNILNNNLQSLLEILFESNVQLTITIETSTPIIINSASPEETKDKIDALKEQIVYHKDNPIKTEFHIEKKDIRDIFDFQIFVVYLTSLTIQGGMEFISKLNTLSDMNFRVWEGIKTQWTDTIIFRSVYPERMESHESNILRKTTKDREASLEKRDKCGHFANASLMSFLPDDFCPSNIHDSTLKIYLNGLYNAALIIYLSDFSSVDDNTLKYRLKGYKLISEILNLEQLKQHSASEIENIYRWTYTEGNFTDKIGLSRNIMSIHLKSDSLLSLEQGASDSVQSGYDLYLKDNVKQYIEIKNKISEFIQGQSDKASEMTKGMFSMFKTGLWAFTTFFISVFLIRIVGKGGDSGVFNTEVYIVSLLLILFSFIYMGIAISEINSDRDRLLKKYEEVKFRYKELLNPNDLNKILDDKSEQKRERDYINTKRNKYTACWIVVNAILLLVVSFLYFFPMTPSQFDNAIQVDSSEKLENSNDKSVATPPSS